VLRESDRLNDTIRNFLAYARPQASRIRTVDLKQVLAEAAQLIRNNPECQSRHQVDVTLPDHQVACDADEAQIRQIVWNLATNGIRAMPDGGALTLAATAGASSVVIRVTDTGVGMSVDALDRIFQPFHGGFAKGAGLGLSIVHRIVTDHGGEIRVSSEVGKGTAVEIHLPVRAPSADAAAPAARAEQTMVA
jgi:two-component system, NtrC family, sensor histidine kinase PilS